MYKMSNAKREKKSPWFAFTIYAMLVIIGVGSLLFHSSVSLRQIKSLPNSVKTETRTTSKNDIDASNYKASNLEEYVFTNSRALGYEDGPPCTNGNVYSGCNIWDFLITNTSSSSLSSSGSGNNTMRAEFEAYADKLEKYYLLEMKYVRILSARKLIPVPQVQKIHT